MFSLFTSNSNVRFLTGAFLALLLFLFVDDLLYRQQKFLDFFGGATQEGQIISKVNRSGGFAKNADIIFFGSSMIRSGVSSEAFIQEGILPYNFAVSGGGPLYSYYGLKRIAPFLKMRKEKPLLILSINPSAVLRGIQVWAEYPQFISVVRNRQETIKDFELLHRTFKSYGMSSRFISGILFPSFIYREHSKYLFINHGLKGYFYGMEDCCGFAPLYSIQKIPWDCESIARQNTMGPYEPTKIEYTKKFISLAESLDCKVILMPAPFLYFGLCHSRGLDDFLAIIKSEFTDLPILNIEDIHFQVGDYDEGGHLNIWGADKLSRRIIEIIDEKSYFNLRSANFEEKWGQLFETIQMPITSTWQISDHKIIKVIDNGCGIEFTSSPDYQIGEFACSPEITVVPDREYILEVGINVSKGRLIVQMASIDDNDNFVRFSESWSQTDQGTRMFTRLIPETTKIKIKLLEAHEPAEGSINFIRLTCQKNLSH